MISNPEANYPRKICNLSVGLQHSEQKKAAEAAASTAVTAIAIQASKKVHFSS